MSPKDLIIDFLYLAFFVALIGGAIMFFIQGGRFDTFTDFIRSAWLIALLLAALAFKLRLTKSEKTRAESTGFSLLTLNLSFNDKMKGEFVVFACPLAVLFIAAISETGVDNLDIIQAIIVLVIAYAWHKYLWLKAR